MNEDTLKLLLAQGASVEEIGRRFDRDPSTVSYWMKKYGLQAAHREKHAARGGISREVLTELVESGCSIGELAARLGRSKGTVRHWLCRHGLRTPNPQCRAGRPGAAEAREAGLLSTTLRCPTHGETEFLVEGRGYYRARLAEWLPSPSVDAPSKRRSSQRPADNACCVAINGVSQPWRSITSTPPRSGCTSARTAEDSRLTRCVPRRASVFCSATTAMPRSKAEPPICR